MAKKVTRAIITSAGRGTRFLPAAKAFQKEMVPVMHKPQLQWVIEEAIEAGFHEMAIVVREGVDTLQRYLGEDNKLWDFLKKTRKEHLMASWLNIKRNADITLFEQRDKDPYGNGTPFILAKNFANKGPVAAMWGDDIMVHVEKDKLSCIRQMVKYFEKYEPTAVLSTEKVTKSEISRYGCMEYLKKSEAKVPYQIKRIIEKPKSNEAPSLMANACRFVLSFEVFEELEKKTKGKGGEIWLTDAIDRLLQKGRIVMAPPCKGSIWVPVGDPVRWLKANLVVALNDKQYRKDVRQMISEIEKNGML